MNYAMPPAKLPDSSDPLVKTGGLAVARILWCAGASRRWLGLAKARPKQPSQPRNLVIGWMSVNPHSRAGAARKAKGAVKDAAGALTGNKKLQADGKAYPPAQPGALT